MGVITEYRLRFYYALLEYILLSSDGCLYRNTITVLSSVAGSLSSSPRLTGGLKCTGP